MRLTVGKIYSFVHAEDKFYMVGKVIRDLDNDDDYYIHILESNDNVSFRVDTHTHISLWMVNNIYTVQEYRGIHYRSQPELIPTLIVKLDEMAEPIDGMAKVNTIVMNDVMYDMFVNMAIDTDDKEWLIELGNWKKSQKGVNV